VKGQHAVKTGSLKIVQSAQVKSKNDDKKTVTGTEVMFETNSFLCFIDMMHKYFKYCRQWEQWT